MDAVEDAYRKTPRGRASEDEHQQLARGARRERRRSQRPAGKPTGEVVDGRRGVGFAAKRHIPEAARRSGVARPLSQPLVKREGVLVPSSQTGDRLGELLPTRGSNLGGGREQIAAVRAAVTGHHGKGTADRCIDRRRRTRHHETIGASDTPLNVILIEDGQ